MILQPPVHALGPFPCKCSSNADKGKTFRQLRDNGVMRQSSSVFIYPLALTFGALGQVENLLSPGSTGS